MTLLSSLFDRAKVLLGRPRPAGTATDAVAHGTLDSLVYDELLADAPVLSELVDELSIRYAGTKDLVRDIVMGFYQPSPKLREQPEMAPSRLRNWSVAMGFRGAPETQETRQYTVGDKYAATMATLGVTSKIRAFLDADEDLADDAEEAQRAGEQLAAAEQALTEAMAAAAGADGADEDATAGLCAALSGAIDGAEAAAELAELTAQIAQQAAERAAKKMQGTISEAVNEAGEDLAEEADLLQAWGIGPGDIAHYSFTERQELAALLRASEVSQHLQLLGRFTYAERSLRAKRVVPGRDEVYDIERSDRIGDVLASELGLLAHPHTSLEFLQRLAEGQLLTRAYRGTEKTGHGAVIACVDTSGSMRAGQAGYSAAAWSKAFALAMLQRCKADGRDFVGIIFSSRHEVQVFRFPKGRAPIEDVVEFVGKSFNGGTNFEAPLETAMDILDDEFNVFGRRRGDIVFITDDNCAVSPAWLAAYRKRKTDLGFRTWGIACGKKRPGQTLDDLSDNVRAIEEFLDPTPVADLLKAI